MLISSGALLSYHHSLSVDSPSPLGRSGLGIGGSILDGVHVIPNKVNFLDVATTDNTSIKFRRKLIIAERVRDRGATDKKDYGGYDKKPTAAIARMIIAIERAS